MLRMSFQRFPLVKENLLLNSKKLSILREYFMNQQRAFRKSYGTVLKVMKGRRKIAGSDRIRLRSEWDNWNYKSELYSFSKRLHENISEETLRRAFVHSSYIKKEEEKRRQLDIPLQDVQLDLKSNSSLIAQGQQVMSSYLYRYLTHCYESIPKEGIRALHDYLMSDEVLAHISYNLGTNDLIFCEEYPPGKATLAETLKAIVGSIAADDSISRAQAFVLDFVCPQLIGKDVFEMWELNDPQTVLSAILEKRGCNRIEPRLIFESGRNTIEAVYHVGLYSDKMFLGRGSGETLAVAEEMAAYDALRRIFCVCEFRRPIPLGQNAKKIEI